MLSDLLASKKKALLKKWIDVTLETYPPDSQGFFLEQKNRFANPLGSSISLGLSAAYDWVVQGAEASDEEVRGHLDRIIRIRAVQEFSAGQAVGFVFLLKDVVRQALKKEGREREVWEDLLILESRIDKLALLVFDIHMQCREKIYDLRANELRNRTGRILERACRTWDAQACGEPENRQHE